MESRSQSLPALMLGAYKYLPSCMYISGILVSSRRNDNLENMLRALRLLRGLNGNFKCDIDTERYKKYRKLA